MSALCDQCHLPIYHLQTLPDRGSINTLVALRKIASQNLANVTCVSNYQQIQKMLWLPNIQVLNVDRGRALDVVDHTECFQQLRNHNIDGLGMDSKK